MQFAGDGGPQDVSKTIKLGVSKSTGSDNKTKPDYTTTPDEILRQPTAWPPNQRCLFVLGPPQRKRTQSSIIQSSHWPQGRANTDAGKSGHKAAPGARKVHEMERIGSDQQGRLQTKGRGMGLPSSTFDCGWRPAKSLSRTTDSRRGGLHGFSRL